MLLLLLLELERRLLETLRTCVSSSRNTGCCCNQPHRSQTNSECLCGARRCVSEGKPDRRAHPSAHRVHPRLKFSWRTERKNKPKRKKLSKQQSSFTRQRCLYNTCSTEAVDRGHCTGSTGGEGGVTGFIRGERDKCTGSTGEETATVPV